MYVYLQELQYDTEPIYALHTLNGSPSECAQTYAHHIQNTRKKENGRE